MPKQRIQKSGRRKGRRMKGQNKHGGSSGKYATTTFSLQRIALLFPPKSLQRVYFHGVWQLSHKRQPSLELDNLRNPRKAFLTAQELEGTYLQAVRQLPRFRRLWTWEDPDHLIQAILNHEPVEKIACMF